MTRSITTRAGLAIASVALGLLLLVNFRAPQDVVLPGTRIGGSTSATTRPGGVAASPGTAVPTPRASTGSGGSGTSSGTFTGSLVDTRYGPVEVQLTISGGKIVKATAVQLPSGGRSGMISAYAGPILNSEALSVQSAQIDGVSGATYTSYGYAQSLQAALDQAGL